MANAKFVKSKKGQKVSVVLDIAAEVNYSIFFLPRGAREFATLPRSDFERVRRAIDGLAENPRPLIAKS
jgi:hypothetical protein